MSPEAKPVRRECWQRPFVAALITLILASAAVGAANQHWLVLAGQAVGPIRLGMAASDIRSTLGEPTSREGGRLWTYDTPAKIRIEFSSERVYTITTWNPRAKTPDGLGVGSTQAAAIRVLGGSPATMLTSAGLWAYDRARGLAVYVERGAVGALAVMPPQHPAANREPVPLSPPRTQPPAPQVQPSPPPSPAPEPTGPVIVLENVAHRVDRTVTITGKVRNAGRIPRPYVEITVDAKTFKGASLEGKIADAIINLAPGASQAFEVDIGKDLWAFYTVRVNTYHGQRPKEPISSVTGQINRSEYLPWANENLTGGVAHLMVSVNRPTGIWGPQEWAANIRVTAAPAPGFPRYANVSMILVRVRWNLISQARGGRSESGEAQIVLTPRFWSAEFHISRPFEFDINASAEAVQVIWTLSF